MPLDVSFRLVVSCMDHSGKIIPRQVLLSKFMAQFWAIGLAQNDARTFKNFGSWFSFKLANHKFSPEARSVS